MKSKEIINGFIKWEIAIVKISFVFSCALSIASYLFILIFSLNGSFIDSIKILIIGFVGFTSLWTTINIVVSILKIIKNISTKSGHL